MPSGSQHHELWQSARIPVALGLGAFSVVIGAETGDAVLAVVLAVSSILGYAVGDVLTPDLDLISIDRGESRMIRSVVFLPLVAWTTLYARIMQGMGGHRSFWSHSLLLSTLIRLCWMLFPLVALLWYLGVLPSEYAALPAVGAFIGLSVSDALHIIADRLCERRRSFFGKLARGADRC
jgi:uncharacterized metal-binding protein